MENLNHLLETNQTRFDILLLVIAIVGIALITAQAVKKENKKRGSGV